MSNDSDEQGATLPSSDAYGQAALLLVESLIHGLCETSALSAHQAVEIAERAISVQYDQAIEAEGAGAVMWQSHALLSTVATSLMVDDQSGPPRPYLVS